MTGLQSDICYVIETRIGFEIAEITRFLNISATIHLLFKIVFNLKILENSEGYVYMKLFVYTTV